MYIGFIMKYFEIKKKKILKLWIINILKNIKSLILKFKKRRIGYVVMYINNFNVYFI